MDKEQLSHILHIQEASKQGRLVVFVGAGVSANSGVPMWGELIKAFKKELPTEIEHETDYLKVAQLYKSSRGHKEYMDKVKSVLKYRSTSPNPIHNVILDLKPCNIITTNYDDNIELAVENTFIPYDVISDDCDLPNMQYPNAIIKMHGDFDADNIVLTEDDYYNYANNFPLIRSYIMSLFASKLVLFVGFSFTDLNLKIILNDVRKVLKEKMQRVYMFTDNMPDNVTSKYFSDKGVNIVLYSEDMNSAANEESINNEHGKKMLNALSYIRDYKLEADALTHIYTSLCKYELELRSFGDGIKYFMPDEFNIHFYSNGIQIFADKPYNISKKKSFQELRKFKELYPNIEWKLLKRFALYNNIFEIDFSCPCEKHKEQICGFSVSRDRARSYLLFGDNSFRNVERFAPDSVHAHMQLFEFDIVNNELLKLKHKELNGTINDLEYLYVLYKLGRYEDAYEQYNRIWPIAWQRKKYIVFFICLYNIYYMSSKLFTQLILKSNFEFETVRKKIAAINLDEILARIHLEEPIRRVLYDIVNSKTIKSHTLKAVELNSEIHKSRLSAEKGGVSINSNIDLLVSGFIKETKFYEYNYMIGDTNDYYKSLSQQTIAGVLNSHATPATTMGDSKFLQTTHIAELRPIDIIILIFAVDHKRLKGIYKEYNITKLRISEESQTEINRFIQNLDNTRCAGLIEPTILENQVENLLFIISKSESKFEIPSLYSCIMKLWNVLNPPQNENLYDILDNLVKIYTPTTDEAKNIIFLILNDSRQHKQEAYFEILSILSNKLEEAKETIKVSAEAFEKAEVVDYLFPLIKILDNDNKSKVEDYCLSHVSYVWTYLNLIWENKEILPSAELLQDLLSRKQRFSKPHTYWMLAKMYKDNHYVEIHNVIDNISKKEECMAFMLDPLHYKKYENVKVEWFWPLTDSIKAGLITVPHYKNLVKSFLYENKLDKASLKYIIGLL